MRLPQIRGMVERRLLVNYRVDPDVVATHLPAPFRPQVVDGWAVAGICLIRLGHMRPRGLPGAIGLRSENAAHRIAVEWDTPDGLEAGVFIPRRDTESLVNRAVGGRLFPGEHEKARFTVSETPTDVRVAFESADGAVAVDVVVRTGEFSSGLFPDLATASRFFEKGAVGYSVTREPGRFDGLELRTNAWKVDPVEVTSVRSSFFDDPGRFPAGTAHLDGALLMRDIPVTWHAQPSLHSPASISVPTPLTT
jgi:hypothetical protein